MSLIWQDHTGTLTSSEKSVLLRMADFAADNGTQIFPSIRRIALDTGLADRTVQRTIESLIVKKKLKRNHRKSNHYSTNIYAINVTELEQAAQSKETKYNRKKPVDKPVNKPCKTQGGGVTMSPGVVSPCHQGGVTMSSNPSLDPPFINTTYKKQQKVLKKGKAEKAPLDSSPPPATSMFKHITSRIGPMTNMEEHARRQLLSIQFEQLQKKMSRKENSYAME